MSPTTTPTMTPVLEELEPPPTDTVPPGGFVAVPCTALPWIVADVTAPEYSELVGFATSTRKWLMALCASGAPEAVPSTAGATRKLA